MKSRDQCEVAPEKWVLPLEMNDEFIFRAGRAKDGQGALIQYINPVYRGKKSEPETEDKPAPKKKKVVKKKVASK